MKYLHTMVRVTDVDASLKFYCDALGLEVLSRKDYPQGKFTLIFLAAPGDRAAQVETAVAKLRGSDPTTHPTTLARLAELARVDVLVAIAVRAGTVKLWWFDSDRGDLMGDPMESRFDPKTGKIAGKLINARTPATPSPDPK